MAIWANQDSHDVIINLIAAALGGAFVWLCRRTYRACRLCAKRHVFGCDFAHGGTYHLVYGSFWLPPAFVATNIPARYPHVFAKTPPLATSARRLSQQLFSIENPISGAEMRSIAYLSQFFGKSGVVAPMLTTDNEVAARLDFSFISFGGSGSNLKTEDAFLNRSNNLVQVTGDRFVDPSTGQPLVEFDFVNFDYGVILRICPSQHDSRTWIVCAGIGEWGTSGSSWFLANKWKKLFWHVLFKRERQFAAIVRVRRGQDESAEIVWKS